MIPLAAVILLVIIGATVLAAVVGGARKPSPWVAAVDEAAEFPATLRNPHPYTVTKMSRLCTHERECWKHNAQCTVDCRYFRLQTRPESDSIQRMG